SLIDVRTFSISTGLAASTVTPGSTPPDASLTVPVMEDCARAGRGASRKNARAIQRGENRRLKRKPIDRLLFETSWTPAAASCFLILEENAAAILRVDRSASSFCLAVGMRVRYASPPAKCAIVSCFAGGFRDQFPEGICSTER